MASFHKQVLDGMVTVIRALGITGLPGQVGALPNAQVYTQVLPFADTTYTLPCVQVTTAPLAETLAGPGHKELSGTDDVGYPCAVAIIAAKNLSYTLDDGVLAARQLIAGTFHNRRPAGMPELLGASLDLFLWEPAAVIDLELFRGANLWASGFVIRAIVRKTRP